jgi:hypothetical protein
MITYATNTRFSWCAFAYGLGEGPTPYRGAEGTVLEDCVMHSHLHDSLYVNAGGGGLTVRRCIVYQCINVRPALEESKLPAYGNCTLADEEPTWISGPGIQIYDCLFGPSWNGKVFAIDGWNGSGVFPRPYAYRGYLGYCTMAAGPANDGAALFGASTHLAHSGLIENLILAGGVAVQTAGAGYSGMVVRNILSASGLPAQLGAMSSQVAAGPVLHAPATEVNAIDFDLWTEVLPDAYATDFDAGNYTPVVGSPARGMAASGAANGITPPVTRPDVGAWVEVDEPPPDPEPEPEPQWWAELTDDEWLDFLSTAISKLADIL